MFNQHKNSAYYELAHYPYSSFQYYLSPKQAPRYFPPLQLIQHFQLEAERTLAHYVTYCHILEKEPEIPYE